MPKSNEPIEGVTAATLLKKEINRLIDEAVQLGVVDQSLYSKINQLHGAYFNPMIGTLAKDQQCLADCFITRVVFTENLFSMQVAHIRVLSKRVSELEAEAERLRKAVWKGAR